MKKLWVCLSAVLLAGLFYAAVSGAATTCDPWIAKMVSVQGNVEARRAGQTEWRRARLNDTYCPGDRIQVGERSRADVVLINQPVLRLDQNSTITLGAVREQRTSVIELIKGAVYFFSRLPRNLEVRTAFVNAGVEGTEGLITAEADRTLILIFEGRVLAENQAGSLAIASGESAVAAEGRAPVFITVIRPRDAVQWTLYYPPAVYFRPEEIRLQPDWQGMVRNSIETFKKNDIQAAFESLKGVPDTVGEPRFFAYRASLLLAVGRVDEAGKDIARALSLNPASSEALALQSVIAVAQNQKEKALDIAKKAVAADPKSGSALIALSYAQQADFDLEGARSSLQQAVQVSPDNALAWARLAELHMSFAELDEALEAAQKAVALNPNLSRTQTVLGFAYLTQVKTTEAMKAFERAIELDQADPLARLGLGLARIREGDLDEGRREIEIAASLDPGNSLIRSYLGKAYFEEKRNQQASKQYGMAKNLDPKDPTPYFYDAIRKQTTNRPVEALHDMQKAIELNDNRGVYRSTLLLESDAAARSAAQGRIYGDLGFQQLALVEAWKSANIDPSNFSAHRLLADSYSVLPRHEIARVSELLQSQLLQPLNTTPIQPRLAESNLFLVSAGGPGTLSFNEFNPLFNRNGVNFQTSGLAGENHTYAGEGVLSGIYKNASFSLGGFHFRTDGWRTNADQNDTIANAFLQLELSAQTSVQGEYRYRNLERGDVRLRFFPKDFLPGQTDKEERNTARLGVRHAFSPDSIVLGSLIYQDAAFQTKVANPGLPFLSIDVRRPESSTSVEFQHLFRSRHVNLVSGAGYAKIDGHLDTFISTILPTPFDLISARFGTDLKHTNIYAYSYINVVKNMTFTLGASGDFTSGESPDVAGIRQFNPKFGFTWNPFPSTTIRAAAFRVLKRTLITDQTLEPTQVAGFNQFFDDTNGTDAWRYGGAIDQKFSQNVFGGLEFSKRDLKSPFVERDVSLGTVTSKEQDMHEYLPRTYLFWTPHRLFAFRAEYMFEHFKSEGLTDLPKVMDTHRIPLGISFFHPHGLSASLRATYINQHGRFVLVDQSLRSDGADFWTIDASINYRLPKRYGFITVGATNLFDKRFKFFDRDIRNPSMQPDRVIFGRVTLALP